MNTKTLLVFIAILSATFNRSYAKEAGRQDSIKRVYVTVVAAEKSLAERFSEYEQVAAAESGQANTNQESTKRRAVYKKSQARSESVPKVSKAGYSRSAQGENNSGMSIIIKKQKPANKLVESTKSTARNQNQVQDKIARTFVNADDNSFSVSEAPAMKTSEIYLWAGMVLIVMGVILGILFGKTALVVSVAGIVFVIIGYTIKV